MATLGDDAIHDVIGSPHGPSHGREGAQAFYEILFADLSEGKVTTTSRLYGDGFLVGESVWHVVIFATYIVGDLIAIPFPYVFARESRN